mgnify:CR=1 FL=1
MEARHPWLDDPEGFGPVSEHRIRYLATIEFEARTTSHTNRRGHHMKLAGKVREEREAMRLQWIRAGKPKPPLPCKVTFYRIAPRKLDEGDNLNSAFKAYRDELAKCFGLTGDGVKAGVSWAYDQRTPAEVGKTKGSYWVRIEIAA